MNINEEVYETSNTPPVEEQAGETVTTSQKLEFEKLSRLQLERYYAIEHRYGREVSLELLSHIKSRGRNSWPAFIEKSTEVHNSEGDDLNYFKALSDAIELDTKLERHVIVDQVSELRARFRLTPFTDNITSRSIDELCKVFLVEEEMVANEGREGKHRVYIPIYRILAE